MPSIEIKPAIKIGMEDILAGIATLETADLEQFLQEVAYLLAKRKTKTLSEKETVLLLKINQPLLKKSVQHTYNKLYQKLQEEEITSVEHQQLMELIKEREKKGAERLAALVQLAQLRKITPKALMQQLGLTALSDA